MSLALNGTNINPNTSDVSIDGVVKDSVDYNGTRVWTRVREHVIVEGGTSYYGGQVNPLYDSASQTSAQFTQYGWYQQGVGRFQTELANLVSFAGYTKLNFRISTFIPAGNASANILMGYSANGQAGYWVHAGQAGQQYLQTNGVWGSSGTGVATININPANTSGRIQVQTIITGTGIAPMQIYINRIWLSN